jgi:hypothetical protein
MYMTHRRTSTSAFLLMFVHLLTVPISFHEFGIWELPGHVAFLGIIAIVLPTLAPRIPFLSKLTGGTTKAGRNFIAYRHVFYPRLCAFHHGGNAPTTKIAINWNQIFVFLGIGSYLYTEVFGRFFQKICAVHRGSGEPPKQLHNRSGAAAKGKADQTCTCGAIPIRAFAGDKGLDESHPFTISSAPS